MKAVFTTILFVAVLLVRAQGQYHLITDQSFYFSGEEMNVNVLKSGADNSEVITMMMCHGGQSIIQGNVQMQDGIATLRFQLPEKLSSRVYSLQIWNQYESIGSIPIRINKRDDENPTKEIIDINNEDSDFIAVELSDTLGTAQTAIAKITSSNTFEWSTMNVSITNRRPKSHVLSTGKPRSEESRKEGLAVRGFIKDVDGNLLTRHSFMMVVPMVNDFYTGQSDDEGYFELDVDVSLPFFDAVFLSLSPQIHHKIQVDLESFGCNEAALQSSETVSAKRELVNTVINDAFSPLDFTDINSDEVVNYSQFYDRQVRPAEFTSGTMFQVFNDIVPKVHVRKNTFGMYALESTTKLKVPPLIFINGIPTYDYDFVLDIEVDQVESIGVIASFKKLRTYFQAGNGGLIEINTVDKDLMPPASGNIVRLKGIDKPLTEEVEINGGEVSFSSLLLYKPSVQLKKGDSTSISFHTSLESGNYYFNVTGVTDGGAVFHQSVPFVIIQANQ
ncbi:hypothetical protein [Ekhidna sp. To15]|uniref:hypothetical protein n=1 Tax=Ekhidna sp. To15 TaxID=3395267 RepID=UPI003F52690D